MSLGASLLFKDSCQDDEDSPEERQKHEYQADSEYYKAAKAIIKQPTLT